MAKPVVDIQLLGAKELEAALNELPLRLAKSTVDRALKKVVQPIADDAASNAPRGSGLPSSLHKKVRVSTQLSRRQRRGTRKKPGDRTVYVGVGPSPIAHLIEFGTGARSTRSGAFRGAVPKQPFMRPAWDGGKMAALDEFGAILGAEIEKAATRLAKRQAKLIRQSK